MKNLILAISLALICSTSLAVIVPSVTDHKPQLGQGLDLRALQYRQTCVDYQWGYSGQPTSLISFDKTMSEATLKLVNHTELNGEVDLFVSSAKLSGKFYQTISAGALSQTLSWGRLVKGKSVVMTNASLNETGRRAIINSDTQYRSLICGDEVVKQIDLGAAIIITATLNFANAEYMEDLSTRIEFETLGLKKVKNISGHHQWGDEFSFIKFGGFQIGGNPEEFDSLLQSLDQLECKISNLEPCFEAIDKLYEYAFGNSGFSQQLYDLKYSENSGYSPLFFHLDSYENVGVSQLKSEESKKNESKKIYFDWVEDRFVKETEVYNSSTSLLQSYRLTEDEVVKIREIQELSWQNSRRLLEEKKNCQQNFVSCLDIHNRVNLKSYDISVLDIPERLYDYCQLAAYSNPHSGYRNLMKKLFEKVEGDCQTLIDNREKIKELDLSSQNIGDVGVLKFLPNLASLDAQSNKIRHLGPLIAAKNLVKLNLKDNEIRSVLPLSQLHNIKDLNLSYNTIQDATSLNFENLQVLKLHGNPLQNIPALDRKSAHIGVKTFSEDGACELERTRQFNRGVEISLVEDYRSLGFAPSYTNPSDPNSPIEGWFLCELVVKSYL